MYDKLAMFRAIKSPKNKFVSKHLCTEIWRNWFVQKKTFGETD